MKKYIKYIPNKTSLLTRLFSSIGAIAIFVYGGYSVYINDLYIPLKRHSEGIHFNGTAAWLMYAAFISVSLILLSFVLDHYDTRDNEAKYKKFFNTMQYIGWSFFALAIVGYFVQKLS